MLAAYSPSALSALHIASLTTSRPNCRALLMRSRLIITKGGRFRLVSLGFATTNWRTGNMRTNSANYGCEPRVQCEPETANFLCS